MEELEPGIDPLRLDAELAKALDSFCDATTVTHEIGIRRLIAAIGSHHFRRSGHRQSELQ